MYAPFLRPRGCPPGIDPRDWRRAINRRLEELHTMMGVLIALLDLMDGDPDLEPALSGFDGPAPTDDREADESEAEFSLGWTAAMRQDGAKWRGGAGDLEQEHDGREPDADAEANGDDEPTLGRSEVMCQTFMQEGWVYFDFGSIGGDGDEA